MAGAFANADGLDLVRVDKLLNAFAAGLLSLFGLAQVNRRSLQHVAVLIQRGDAAAPFERGVDTKHTHTSSRRRKEEIAKVLNAGHDGLHIRFTKHDLPHTLEYWREECLLKNLLHRAAKMFDHPFICRVYETLAEMFNSPFDTHLYFEGQKAKRCAPADTQDLPSGDLSERFGKVKILSERLAFFLFAFDDFGDHSCPLECVLIEELPVFRVFRNLQGDNVKCALNRGVRIGNALLRISQPLRERLDIAPGIQLHPHHHCELCQPERLRPFGWPPVQTNLGSILKYFDGRRSFDPATQVVRELFLLFQLRKQLGLSALQFTKLGQSVVNTAYRTLAQIAGHILPKPGNEWNAAPVFQQGNNVADTLRRKFQLPCNVPNQCSFVHEQLLTMRPPNKCRAT